MRVDRTEKMRRLGKLSAVLSTEQVRGMGGVGREECVSGVGREEWVSGVGRERNGWVGWGKRG